MLDNLAQRTQAVYSLLPCFSVAGGAKSSLLFTSSYAVGHFRSFGQALLEGFAAGGLIAKSDEAARKASRLAGALSLLSHGPGCRMPGG